VTTLNTSVEWVEQFAATNVAAEPAGFLQNSALSITFSRIARNAQGRVRIQVNASSAVNGEAGFTSWTVPGCCPNANFSVFNAWHAITSDTSDPIHGLLYLVYPNGTVTVGLEDFPQTFLGADPGDALTFNNSFYVGLTPKTYELGGTVGDYDRTFEFYWP
jgi:hypothetical protein